MKKVMFLMAVAGMFAFAACNNTPAPEPEAEPEPTEIQEPVEENADSTATMETPAEETTEAVAE